MRKGIIFLGLALAFAMLKPVAPADAKSRTVKATTTSSGIFVTANFTFDKKSTAAHLQVFGKGAGGSFSGQSVEEIVTDGKSCTVTGGQLNKGTEFTVAGQTTAARFSNGDLIFSKGTSGTQCLDFSSGAPPFHFEGTSVQAITGGTGRFKGVTGTQTATFNGTIVSAPMNGSGGSFGIYQETSTGSLVFP